MNVNYPDAAIDNLINEIFSRINYAKELSIAAGVKEELLQLYEDVYAEILKLQSIIKVNNFSTGYANQLARDLDKFCTTFSSNYGSNVSPKPIVLQEEEKPIFKLQQEREEQQIKDALSNFKVTFDFFAKLDFLNKNLVVIGTNGSGKTFLANNLKKHIKDNGVIVSAQRILFLPQFDKIKSQAITSQELKKAQLGDKTNKNLDFKNLQTEFETLIQNMLAEDAASHKQFTKKAHENAQQGIIIEPPSLTKLERALNIWNSLFKHLLILQDDGMNIRAHTGSLSFSAMEMSDGEKVTLFLIAQVLQSPQDGFIIVDEPEMYLHPTIHKKLWDKLEIERPDSRFIYLTHDLDFASSRVQAKKLWLRLFNYPEKYILEEIPSNEIPEPLLLELLGSRQNIMFCEGEEGSLDEKIYSILFYNHIVKPVGGCLSVISYTKAFNKIPNIATKAVGIIDIDYNSKERLKSLEPEMVFGIHVAEVENLLFDETILISICDELNLGRENILRIKEEVIDYLSKEKEFQISNYLSAKVDYYFKDTNVPRGNNISILKSNLEGFLEKIDLEAWANDRAEQIDKIVAMKDYTGAIQILNSKGLKSITNSVFKLRDFNEIAVRHLQREKKLQNNLLNYFPEFLTSNKPMG
ncbi:MAG: AAA family ATPase [Cyclobacteriaceae bacterium]